MPAEALQVVPCRRGDMLAIRRILEDAPEAAMWSEEALAAARNATPDQFLVAQMADEIVGFVLGREIGSEAEILNLAVKQEFRCAGVGSALVNTLLKQYDAGGIGRVFLEVRESNGAAIAFYERLGFQQIGRRVGYYRDPVEAALVLARGTCAKG